MLKFISVPTTDVVKQFETSTSSPSAVFSTCCPEMKITLKNLHSSDLFSGFNFVRYARTKTILFARNSTIKLNLDGLGVHYQEAKSSQYLNHFLCSFIYS